MLERTYRKNWRNGLIAWVFVGGLFLSPIFALASTARAGMIGAGFFVAAWLVVLARYARRNLTRAAFDRKIGELAAQSAKERVRSSPPGSVEILLFATRVEVVENDQQLAKPWSSVMIVAEEEGAAYIEFKDKTVLRVPDRAFGSEAERRAFVQEAKRLSGT